MSRGLDDEIAAAFANIWRRRIAKRDAMGMHGILFDELRPKAQYGPTRKDEEAVNPDGSRLGDCCD